MGKQSIRVVNLKDGMPLVREALARMDQELRRARADGIGALKLVHGYGSQGVGGEIRIAVQNRLLDLAARHEIGGVIFGEDWRISSETTWALLKRIPGLKSDVDLGRGNQGISLVVL